MRSSTWIHPVPSHHPSAPKLETIKGSSAQLRRATVVEVGGRVVVVSAATVVEVGGSVVVVAAATVVEVGGRVVVAAATVEVVPAEATVVVTSVVLEVVAEVVGPPSAGTVVLAPSPAQAAHTITRPVMIVVRHINGRYPAPAFPNDLALPAAADSRLIDRLLWVGQVPPTAARNLEAGCEGHRGRAASATSITRWK